MSPLTKFIRLVAAALCAVTLSCAGPPCQDHPKLPAQTDDKGHIVISVGIQCPGLRVSSYTVSPLAVSVGGTIDVSAAGESDGSLGDAGALTFEWTAPVGTFADPKAAHTKYTCTVPGVVKLTVTVSNGDCRAPAGMDVTCKGDCDGSACDAGTDR